MASHPGFVAQGFHRLPYQPECRVICLPALVASLTPRIGADRHDNKEEENAETLCRKEE
ncbi:MAG: hypothetical protein IPO35_16610 [Uliginosibacterium sp.]|nr:hypothetical protein [Uliginosibacterium sp.]